MDTAHPVDQLVHALLPEASSPDFCFEDSDMERIRRCVQAEIAEGRIEEALRVLSSLTEKLESEYPDSPAATQLRGLKTAFESQLAPCEPARPPKSKGRIWMDFMAPGRFDYERQLFMQSSQTKARLLGEILEGIQFSRLQPAVSPPKKSANSYDPYIYHLVRPFAVSK